MESTKHKIKTSTILLLCTVFSIVLIIAGIVCAILCLRNFEAVQAANDLNTALAGVNADLTASIRAEIVILVLLAITVAVIYYVNIKTIVRPTLQMEKHFAKIAEGDLHTECPLPEDSSEIGQLVTSANLMQKSFGRYIRTIEAVLSALADGDLAVKTDQDFQGDFIRIRSALERVTTSLGGSFAEINNATVEMSFGAEQISIGATSLSEGSSEQAATIEELTSTMSEVSLRVTDTVNRAESVRSAATEMMTVIRAGSESLSRQAGYIEKTGEYSADIRDILKLIDNIAFQTNILALNAAVEAARAGDNGAAFGVVANEVRVLSNQTAEKAKATGQLIEDMLAALANCVEVAKTTENSLTSIVDSADNVLQLVEKITEAMESDAAAVEESLAGLEQLSAVVQENSATAEESAAASQEIAAQAVAVRELVGKFKS